MKPCTWGPLVMFKKHVCFSNIQTKTTSVGLGEINCSQLVLCWISETLTNSSRCSCVFLKFLRVVVNDAKCSLT